jgi:hypothetical protein
MSRLVPRAVLLTAAIACASSAIVARRQDSPPLAPLAQLTVADAVARYAAGDHEAAVRGLASGRLPTAQFTRDLDAWIAAGDTASASRRRLVAAAFGLDAVWTATRTFVNEEILADPWKRGRTDDPSRCLLDSFCSQSFVAHWAAKQLPVSGTPDDLERTIWLTAVGIAEDSYDWRRLPDEILPLARMRIAGEPRLRLAEVLARTNRDLGPLRGATVEHRMNGALHVERLSSVSRIPGAIRAFEPLLADAVLVAEVELRIGYLELRRGQWADAIARFDAARTRTSDLDLRAMADYFAGWVHEQQERPDDAIAAYRRSLERAPLQRHLATRLAALLYLRHDRAEAYAVLDRALNARPVPVDLLLALERGDARFVPGWLASIRRALQ